MDLRKIKKLIELVEESGIAELEVSSGDESVRIARYGNPPTAVVQPAAIAADVATSNVTPAVMPTAPEIAIVAPMAGTFYRAPSPEAEPFVAPGSQVQAGDVVCIIESMKMMHEIHAEQAGVVQEICVANATPISTGATLLRLS